MRKTITGICLAFVALTCSAFAQDSLIAGPYHLKVDTFLLSQASSFRNQWTVLMGGGVCVKVNDTVYIGGEIKISTPMIPGIMTGYAGPDLGIILFGNSVVHVEIGTLLGVEFLAPYSYFVLEPAIRIETNITRYIRLGVDAGYRFTFGANGQGVTDADMQGILIGGSLVIQVVDTDESAEDK
jgi:hypothetical protein